MKPQDRYLAYVRWSDEDRLYVGYCPDLFPAGGVCHGTSPVETFGRLWEIIEDTVSTASSEGLALPAAKTRPMREVEEAA